jgi:Ulp1 family protease
MDDEIELSYNNISLRKTDINTFKNYSQLNDLSISFYYEYLNEIYKANQNYFQCLVTLTDCVVSP